MHVLFTGPVLAARAFAGLLLRMLALLLGAVGGARAFVGMSYVAVSAFAEGSIADAYAGAWDERRG